MILLIFSNDPVYKFAITCVNFIKEDHVHANISEIFSDITDNFSKHLVCNHFAGEDPLPQQVNAVAANINAPADIPADFVVVSADVPKIFFHIFNHIP